MIRKSGVKNSIGEVVTISLERDWMVVPCLRYYNHIGQRIPIDSPITGIIIAHAQGSTLWGCGRWIVVLDGSNDIVFIPDDMCK